jgi:hypothetical protein
MKVHFVSFYYSSAKYKSYYEEQYETIVFIHLF